MKTFDPNRQESYSQAELIALHKQAETNSRFLLAALDLPRAHAQISTMEQIRARFAQDCQAPFPQAYYTTLQSD